MHAMYGMTIIVLHEIKHKLVTNYGMYSLYSTCKKHHYRYLNLGYDIFNMPASIGNDVALTNNKILHDLLNVEHQTCQ